MLPNKPCLLDLGQPLPMLVSLCCTPARPLMPLSALSCSDVLSLSLSPLSPLLSPPTLLSRILAVHETAFCVTPQLQRPTRQQTDSDAVMAHAGRPSRSGGPLPSGRRTTGPAGAGWQWAGCRRCSGPRWWRLVTASAGSPLHPSPPPLNSPLLHFSPLSSSLALRPHCWRNSLRTTSPHPAKNLAKRSRWCNLCLPLSVHCLFTNFFKKKHMGAADSVDIHTSSQCR